MTYRPDIQYVQGMSYLMVIFLMFYKPYEAFKYFSNLVLTRKLIYKTYLFRKPLLDKICNSLRNLVYHYFPELYQKMSINKVEMWNIYWIEWVYALFLRSFDLKTSLVLWDAFFLYGDIILFKLCYAVFKILNEQIDIIDFQHFHDQTKTLLIKNQNEILKIILKKDTKINMDIEHLKELINNN